MAGQGGVTRKYAELLKAEGWDVLFLCIPNRVHFGVVPIPTAHGVSKQRYPDIAAVKGRQLLLVEVEMSLSTAVVIDISLRFDEMRSSLFNPEIYQKWSSKVQSVSGIQMPANFELLTQLFVVNGGRCKKTDIAELEKMQISVVLNSFESM